MKGQRGTLARLDVLEEQARVRLTQLEETKVELGAPALKPGEGVTPWPGVAFALLISAKVDNAFCGSPI